MIPLSSARGRGRSSSASVNTSGNPGHASIVVVNAPTVNPSTVILPPHIVEEARRLATGASKDNPITEPTARPLVQSTCVWLMRQGVIGRTEHPGVITEVGTKLHDIISIDKLHATKGKATTFAHRINVYLANHVRNSTGSLKLEVGEAEELNTPMKALESAGLVSRVPEPKQGHSGQSIVGKGRSRAPAVDPHPFPNGGMDACVSFPNTGVQISALPLSFPLDAATIEGLIDNQQIADNTAQFWSFVHDLKNVFPVGVVDSVRFPQYCDKPLSKNDIHGISIRDAGDFQSVSFVAEVLNKIMMPKWLEIIYSN